MKILIIISTFIITACAGYYPVGYYPVGYYSYYPREYSYPYYSYQYRSPVYNYPLTPDQKMDIRMNLLLQHVR